MAAVSRRLLLAAPALLLTGRGSAAFAPRRAVRVVVGFAPGGGTDIAARIVAQGLAERWKVPVTVENRTGAGTTIASAEVARAEPDGHTLLAIASSYTTSATLYRNLPYDPMAAFAGVVQFNEGPFCIAAHPSFPASTVADLIAESKRRPGGLTYASSGAGGHGHMAGAYFTLKTGAPLEHIAYRGSAPAVTDVIAGRVPLIFSDLFAVLVRIRAAELKLIATTGLSRARSAPDAPTVVEAGVPGYEVVGWTGMLAPAATPPDVLAALNADCRAVLADPATVQRFGPQAHDLVGGSGDAFLAKVRDEIVRWRAVIEASGITAPEN
jgi:tripartite-type tricarboxylate transporter receptor subunit TctC